VAPAQLGVEQRLAVNARAAGPRLGKQVQFAIKGAKTGDWSLSVDGTVTSGGITLEAGEYSLDLVAGSGADAEGSAIGVLRGGDFLVLDTRLTPELEAEGTARDVIRAIQQARRGAGLEVSDRIRLGLTGDTAVIDAVRANEQLVASEVLATEMTPGTALADAQHSTQEKVAGGTVEVTLRST
jgi:isoleucyl-tRNA synthetase